MGSFYDSNTSITWTIKGGAKSPHNNGKHYIYATFDKSGAYEVKATIKDDRGTYEAYISPKKAADIITNVNISGPTTVVAGGISSYTVVYANSMAGQEPAIKWSIPGGSIVKGQGHKSVEVKFDNVNVTTERHIEVTITPSVVGGGVSKRIPITVMPAISNVKILGWNYISAIDNVYYTYSYFVDYMCNTSGMGGPTITWSIDGGVITSGQGTQRIYVRFHDSMDTKYITVTVTPPVGQAVTERIPLHILSISDSYGLGSNGYITGKICEFCVLLDGRPYPADEPMKTTMEWRVNDKLLLDQVVAQWEAHARYKFTEPGKKRITVRIFGEYYEEIGDCSLTVQVENLNIPVISANKTFASTGDVITFTVNNYQPGVNYHWFIEKQYISYIPVLTSEICSTTYDGGTIKASCYAMLNGQASDRSNTVTIRPSLIISPGDTVLKPWNPGSGTLQPWNP